MGTIMLSEHFIRDDGVRWHGGLSAAQSRPTGNRAVLITLWIHAGPNIMSPGRCSDEFPG